MSPAPERAEATATVCNQRGLHARAAARVCETAASFEAAMTVSKGGVSVGAGSLMALLMLGAAKGTTLRLTAEGPDAEQAVRVLSALIEGGVGEGC